MCSTFTNVCVCVCVCVQRVSNALKAQPDVLEVDVDLESGKAVVRGYKIEAASMCAALSTLGFAANTLSSSSSSSLSSPTNTSALHSSAGWSRMIIVSSDVVNTTALLATVVSSMQPPLALLHSGVGDDIALHTTYSCVFLQPLLTLLGAGDGGAAGVRETSVGRGGDGLFVIGLTVADYRVAAVGVALEAVGIALLPVVSGWVSDSSSVRS